MKPPREDPIVARFVTSLIDSVSFLFDLSESLLRDAVGRRRAAPAAGLMFTAREELCAGGPPKRPRAGHIDVARPRVCGRYALRLVAAEDLPQ